jgi:hypothetical protein
MDSKELDTEIKPVPVRADEEIGEGRLHTAELDGEENTNEEFSYESHRSPFPEGECIVRLWWCRWTNSCYS